VRAVLDEMRGRTRRLDTRELMSRTVANSLRQGCGQSLKSNSVSRMGRTVRPPRMDLVHNATPVT